MYKQEEIDQFVNMFYGVLPEDAFTALKNSITKNGSYDVERILSRNFKKLTPEIVKECFDGKWNNMFQNGIAHISWNTDRQILGYDMCNASEEISRYQCDSTWYYGTKIYYKYGPYFFCKYYEESKTSISSKVSYSFIDEKDVPKKATHVAIAIGIGKSKSFINDDFYGSQEECELQVDKWVKRYGKSYVYRIFPIPE